jgi:tRNA dimethylallyltransferase
VAGKAFALLGPTASGKSSLAMALAERLPLEIVSMDSAQVYRGLDIGTAKPSAAERARVPHHLIDVLDPDRSYSTGRWRADAIAAVKDILARGKMPLIVGGTMLYYRALVGGLDALPQADAQVRAQINAEAASRGWPALHAELEAIDPKSARRISPGDTQRIQRALEVWRITGKPLSSLQGQARGALPFTLKAFALVPAEREGLHERIAQRFDAMLKAGLVEELKALRQCYSLTPGMPSMRAVGYRQVWDYLEGEIDARAMREQAVAATRQLAKRQLTSLRSLGELEPAPADPERFAHSFL